jgi:RNAse (barnase) inhibitor barstar
MNDYRMALWALIALSVFILMLLLHLHLRKKSVFRTVIDNYRRNMEKKTSEENWFISKYGVIENRSLFYKIDRLIVLSGIKSTFKFLNGEWFLIIAALSFLIAGITTGNIAGNAFLGLFAGFASITAEFIILLLMYGRTYNRIEDDTSLFVSILTNHAKGSSDIITIMSRTLSSLDGPLRDLVSKFLLDSEQTGNVDIAFDHMKESVDNRTLQTIIVNLKNCMHYQANYEEVLTQMLNQISEAMAAREERKNIMFSMKLTLVSISVMSVIIVWLIGKGIGVDVWDILTGNTFGQVILFVTGLLYLFVTTRLFGVDR